jgi:hypothetical protein
LYQQQVRQNQPITGRFATNEKDIISAKEKYATLPDVPKGLVQIRVKNIIFGSSTEFTGHFYHFAITRLGVHPRPTGFIPLELKA